MWKKLKDLFGGGKAEPPPKSSQPASGPPELTWMKESPWGVAVIDLRPLTLGVLSTSTDPQMAANAVSYGRDDGTSFISQVPPSSDERGPALRFHVDGPLGEGALFRPRAMEDKWALYYRDGRLLCIRSWQRKVMVSAPLRIEGDEAVIGPFTGSLAGEPPHLTSPLVAFLVRTHALGDVIPAPLESEPEDLRGMGVFMFQLWGRNVQFATHHALPPSQPRRGLRSAPG